MSVKNECRLIPSVAGLKIEATEATFYLYDHLINTCLTFSDRDGSGDIDVATEVLQQEHYYPYGMTYNSPRNQDSVTS